MEERLLDSAQDIRRLQRCMNDVVSLLALPAVWSDGRSEQILTTVLDAILGMLNLDFVYGRLRDHGPDVPIELVKTARSRDLAERSHEICKELRHRFEGDPQAWPAQIRNRFAGQEFSVIPARLGLQGEIGIIAAGSHRVGFPEESEKLVLNIAANQAAIGLQQARLLNEQKWLATELDRRVAQRTEELAAANEELRREIAERERKEEELRLSEKSLREAHGQVRRSEERWRAVFENSAIGVALTDLNGRYIALNPVYEKMLGYTRAELLNLSFLDVTEEEYRDPTQSLVDELLAGKSHRFQIEKQYRRKDGGLVWVRNSVSVVPGTELMPGFLMALSEDITERKRAEDELKRSEAKHRLVIETASDAVISIDEKGTIVFANPATKTIFSYDSKDLIGKPLTVLMPESMKKMHVAGYNRYLESGERHLNWHGTEVTARRANGDEFPVEVSFGEMQLDGCKVFTGCIRDITEKGNWKRAQEELRKAQAELANMMRVVTMGHLTASIAHEINQPLFGIVTNASTCLRMLSADPPNVDGARETVRRTIRDGNRASDLITRLRTLFTKRGIAAELVDLNEATREVVELLLGDLQRSRVVIRQELADDLPLVQGDRIQLQQVILNLLRNASDAMQAVDDRPREMVITTGCDNGDKVCLSVQDAGVGLEPQTAEKLFERFFTTKSDGMGIGLSICRTIIEAHHGRIWVTQSDGPGCTFTFSIPQSPEGIDVAGRRPTN
jgi:PAS domain S-box-containing protein